MFSFGFDVIFNTILLMLNSSVMLHLRGDFEKLIYALPVCLCVWELQDSGGDISCLLPVNASVFPRRGEEMFFLLQTADSAS